MKEFDINNLLRENIKKLVPYASARSDFKGNARVFLDANENNLGGPYNRYPDPLQGNLKAAISELKGVPASKIFIGNGSDEAIDLLIRAFCEPRIDKVIICPPTYGMYAVAAGINDIEVIEVALNEDFNLNVEEVLGNADSFTKMIFICSPNNPSGNLIDAKDIEFILNSFSGIVVLDEAYMDFSSKDSCTKKLSKFPNLVVLQTFSKAWGLAGLRIGTAFASEEIITTLNNIKPPYNINEATQQLALEALSDKGNVNEWIKEIIAQREVLRDGLDKFSFVERIYPSNANFLLIKVNDASHLYAFLAKDGIIVRNRTNMPGCENCLRITVGTAEENEILLNTLNNY